MKIAGKFPKFLTDGYAWCRKKPKTIRIVMDREQFKALIAGQALTYSSYHRRRPDRVELCLEDIGFSVMLHEVREAMYAQQKARRAAVNDASAGLLR